MGSRWKIWPVSLLLLLAILSSTWAGIGIYVADDPKFPGVCLHYETGARLPEGASWELPGCQKSWCEKSGPNMVIKTVICAPFVAPPNCTIVKDYRKPFGGCCGDVVC